MFFRFFKLFLVFLFLITELTAQKKDIKKLTIGPFFGLKVYSGLEVRLISSNINKAIIYGKNSDNVIVTLHKDILKIKLSVLSALKPGSTYIDLYHSNHLNKIKVHQGSKLSADKVLKQKQLELEATTGATIMLDAITERTKVIVSTGGLTYLKGETSFFDLKGNTGGICEAENFKAIQVNTKMIAAGYSYVSSSNRLDAKVIAGGVLRVFGNPIKQITYEMLGGKIYIENKEASSGFEPL